MKLSDKAVLVTLSISQWAGRKRDKNVEAEINQLTGSDNNTGSYFKNLLPGDNLLGRIHERTNMLRTAFYQNTLPWGKRGEYLLPTKNYLGFTQWYRGEEAEWKRDAEAFVDNYVRNYDAVLMLAQQKLKGNFKLSDYPDPDSMVDKFSIGMAVAPVPDHDFRNLNVDDAERAAIAQEVEKRVTAAQQSAMQDAWKRLHDQLKHIATKLDDPGGIFRDSMIGNMRELCDLLPRLNFADDPNLDRMADQIRQRIAGYHPDAYRNDPDLRRDTAAEANQILDAMGAFMGGVK